MSLNQKSNFQTADILKAVELLEQGQVVGFPTETVYGLAGRVDRPSALELIFQLKERPLFDPLIVHVSGVEMAKIYARGWNSIAQSLAESFWPGPLTLVLPKSDLIPSIVSSGLETVGLRSPRNKVAQELIQRSQVGLAAPSANKFGRTSPTRKEHVDQEFGGQVFTPSAEASEVGIESTVLEIKGDQLILHRLGATTRSQIELCLSKSGLKFQWQAASGDRAQAPGQMKHHYMPAVPLIWVSTEKSLTEIKQAYLSALPQLPDQVEGVKIQKVSLVQTIRELVLPLDATLAARELYHQLRVVSQGADLIYFKLHAQMVGENWSPVLERLTKAATLKLD